MELPPTRDQPPIEVVNLANVLTSPMAGIHQPGEKFCLRTSGEIGAGRMLFSCASAPHSLRGRRGLNRFPRGTGFLLACRPRPCPSWRGTGRPSARRAGGSRRRTAPGRDRISRSGGRPWALHKMLRLGAFAGCKTPADGSAARRRALAS
jgi:hypothetical protein